MRIAEGQGGHSIKREEIEFDVAIYFLVPELSNLVPWQAFERTEGAAAGTKRTLSAPSDGARLRKSPGTRFRKVYGVLS